MRKEKIKFIKRTIIFLIIFLIVFVLLNQLYFNLIIPQKNIYRSQVQYLEFLESNPKIIILGDSHAANDLNPEFIENAFNYAIPSENYEQTFYKIRKILKDTDTIEVFILPLDIHSFSNYRSNPYNEVWYWLEFLSLNELISLTDKSKFNLLINQNFPFIGNGEEFTRLFFNDKKTKMIMGWQKNEEKFTLSNNLTLSSKKRVDLQFQNFPEVINKKLFFSFINSIKLLNDNNKTIILIKYPLTQEYMSAVNIKGITMETYYSGILGIISKYDNIYIFDYQELFKDNPYLFSDPDHLNYINVDMFSKKVNNDLNELGLN